MTSPTAFLHTLTVRGRARREQILASAAALMAERGYPAVSLPAGQLVEQLAGMGSAAMREGLGLGAERSG
ncbi:hypothetical protein [Arthrobacter sp. AZCC_0090]|uniref:hypothetical protein n=1 Tax=Arthrobacter sp. AZCC_0090 TaxID=2735881 RepID=UPI00160DCB7E|nr:hypothetical protein [Arthrobacter sp. AZCC_0090]MBB6407100.1 hypothetical protein [Arthrobacter sp. AZCC_0090]